jgi:hypothetical protein
MTNVEYKFGCHIEMQKRTENQHINLSALFSFITHTHTHTHGFSFHPWEKGLNLGAQ